ncbi:hypothetical protein HPB47_007871 [Ixodes persulcatus]|uniref:Uncharacterized protein n=1 Tax=Ixodes persulcatus TaxID=34615 RepID=A0AC60P688_IXOPE|nr:hypothetical protein HPB47_007871 [Ixodes persulcatus]
MTAESSESTGPEETFVPEHAAVEELAEQRKQEEIERALSKKLRSGVTTAYGVGDKPTTSAQSCSTCSKWLSNLRSAFDASGSYHERCRLLTLLPESLSTKEIQDVIPSATRYLLRKSRHYKEKLGVWAIPDPYTRWRVSEAELQVAMDYYTKDELNCTQQSPNRKDVVGVMVDGTRQYIARRVMTRSICEAYRMYKAAHPDTAIGLTKFYSLKPKCVVHIPSHEVCVCVYCANTTLAVCALEKITGVIRSAEDLRDLTLCSPPSAKCSLGECWACPSVGCFEATNLGIPDEEVLYAVWEKGDLIKKEVNPSTLLEHLQECVRKWTSHDYIRRLQGKAISDETNYLRKSSIVPHFDLAENWTVVLPEEIQSYHCRKSGVSIFTSVVTTRKGTCSCAVISDEICHHSAHACYAVSKVHEWLEEKIPVYAHVTYVSDGPASHFKNKYQLHELQRSKYTSTKLIFSATGHDKSACDGIGGLVKHQATLYNLRGPTTSVIKSASEMVTALNTKLPNVELIHLPKASVKAFRDIKAKEWDSVSAVRGVQSCHLWQCTRSGTSQS